MGIVSYISEKSNVFLLKFLKINMKYIIIQGDFDGREKGLEIILLRVQ